MSLLRAGSPLKFRAASVPALLARSVPTSITISAIDVKAKIVSLGLDSEGKIGVFYKLKWHVDNIIVFAKAIK